MRRISLLAIMVTALYGVMGNAAQTDCYDAPSGRTETSLLIRARLAQVVCVREYYNVTWPIEWNAKDMERKNVLNIVSEIRGANKDQAYEIAVMAIAKGVDLENKDIYDNAPLCNSPYGLPKMTKLLVDSGADVNTVCQSGDSPLTSATKLETLDLLISKGANVNANNGSPLRTQVNWSINNGGSTWNEDILRVKILLDNGADIQPGFEEAERLAKLFGVDPNTLKTYQWLKAYKKP